MWDWNEHEALAKSIPNAAAGPGAGVCSYEPSDWNSANAVPLSAWLSVEQNQRDKSRLHTLGNCVVPVMAQCALAKLTEMVNLAL